MTAAEVEYIARGRAGWPGWWPSRCPARCAACSPGRRLLGTEDVAAAAVADLRDRVAAVERQAEGDPSRSITSLLIFEGTIFPNASRSMGHAQLEVLGLDNVFGDVDEAFFEASVEELIAQDPDVVVLGYGFLEGDTVKTLDRAKAEFLALPGVTGTSAVRNDDIVGLLAREDEPGVAAVDGLESLTAALAGPD